MNHQTVSGHTESNRGLGIRGKLVIAGVSAVVLATGVLFWSANVTPGNNGEPRGDTPSMLPPNTEAPAIAAETQRHPLPRFVPSPKVNTTPIDEHAHKMTNPRLASAEPRPLESPAILKIRLRFISEYQDFVERAGLSPEQEERFRQALADAQLKRERLVEKSINEWAAAKSKAELAGRPAPPDDDDDDVQLQAEKRIQLNLQNTLATILSPEQTAMLRQLHKYMTLRYVTALGSKPFEMGGEG